MPNYLLAYHGGGEPESEAAQAAAMLAWNDWLETTGEAMLDLGSPVGAIFGVLLLALVETLVTNLNFGPLVGETFLYVPLAYGPAAGFCLLVVTLMFRPRGLFHSESKRV